MIEIRKGNERGHARHGWLESFHTFSFADYHDPVHRGFRKLRVINEDILEPGQGFAPHSHQDMEIVTYLLEGALEHKDSMGNTSVIHAGEVQRMSAGSGVTHSEYNASPTEKTHLLQIWIFTAQKGIEPGYEQKEFGFKGKKNRLRRIISPDGRDGSLTIHQDAEIYDASLAGGKSLGYSFLTGRYGWLQVIKGAIRVLGNQLEAGDGAGISKEETVQIKALTDVDFLLFDLD